MPLAGPCHAACLCPPLQGPPGFSSDCVRAGPAPPEQGTAAAVECWDTSFVPAEDGGGHIARSSRKGVSGGVCCWADVPGFGLGILLVAAFQLSWKGLSVGAAYCRGMGWGPTRESDLRTRQSCTAENTDHVLPALYQFPLIHNHRVWLGGDTANVPLLFLICRELQLLVWRSAVAQESSAAVLHEAVKNQKSSSWCSTVL